MRGVDRWNQKWDVLVIAKRAGSGDDWYFPGQRRLELPRHVGFDRGEGQIIVRRGKLRGILHDLLGDRLRQRLGNQPSQHSGRGPQRLCILLSGGTRGSREPSDLDRRMIRKRGDELLAREPSGANDNGTELTSQIVPPNGGDVR